MTLNEEVKINEIIIQVLCKQLGLEEDDVYLEKTLTNDLGADSLDMVEMGFELEEKLMINDGTHFHDNLNFNCTVKELIEYTLGRVNNK